jgi:hypothetical protein
MRTKEGEPDFASNCSALPPYLTHIGYMEMGMELGTTEWRIGTALPPHFHVIYKKNTSSKCTGVTVNTTLGKGGKYFFVY